MAQDGERVVVLGSGIVGLCSSYYLLRASPSAHVTVIENSLSGAIAPGASSQAGGFLAGGDGAGGWVGEASISLAQLSWKEHLHLVQELNGREKWGFRETGATGLRVGGHGNQSRSAYRDLPQGKKEEVVGVDWLEGEREDLTNGEGGAAKGIGQIDPAQFCQALHAHLSTNPRFQTIFGSVESISHPDSSALTRTLRLTKLGEHTPTTIPFTKLLVAAGPWSGDVCAKLGLPSLPLVNLPGHSLLIRPSLSAVGLHTGDELPSGAVFAGIGDAVSGVHAATSGTGRFLSEEEIKFGCTAAPELFPRTNGLVYVAGENSVPTAPSYLKARLPNRLPDNVDLVKQLVDPQLISRLVAAAAAVSPALRVENGAVIEKEQFCYRPKTLDGECMIGELEKGVFVATGHGPWGITLAPGTGKIVSELIFGGQLSADISRLGLDRFRAKAKL